MWIWVEWAFGTSLTRDTWRIRAIWIWRIGSMSGDIGTIWTAPLSFTRDYGIRRMRHTMRGTFCAWVLILDSLIPRSTMNSVITRNIAMMRVAARRRPKRKGMSRMEWIRWWSWASSLVSWWWQSWLF